MTSRLLNIHDCSNTNPCKGFRIKDYGVTYNWVEKYFDEYIDVNNNNKKCIIYPFSIAYKDITDDDGNITTLFVAVGANNSHMYSYDLINWTVAKIDTKISVSVNCVIYDGNKFVAVNNSGYYIYSTDGKSWSDYKSTGANAALNSIAYSPVSKRYVIVGEKGTILYTSAITDNSTFTKLTVTSSKGNAAFLRYVTYIQEKNIFVIAGDENILLYSSDGINWIATGKNNESVITEPGANHQFIVYDKNNDVFVTASDYGLIFYTHDIKSDTWKTSDSGIKYEANDGSTTTEPIIHNQAVAYDYLNNVYTMCGWESTTITTNNLQKQWVRYINKAETSAFQFAIFHPIRGIILVGKGKVIIGKEPKRLLRYEHIEDEYKNTIYKVGSKVTTSIRENPRNYLYFGRWKETYDATTGLYTYTREK